MDNTDDSIDERIRNVQTCFALDCLIEEAKEKEEQRKREREKERELGNEKVRGFYFLDLNSPPLLPAWMHLDWSRPFLEIEDRKRAKIFYALVHEMRKRESKKVLFLPVVILRLAFFALTAYECPDVE